MVSATYSLFFYFMEVTVNLIIHNGLGEIYTHGSVHHEANLITVQQDATVFSLLHFSRQLYMFRVLTPIIRSWYSCNYSFWY